MNKNPLLKYKLGLLLVGVFTLVLAGIVIVQASATKQDAETDKKANVIVEKLNNYIDDKQVIPSSLREAGATDVPSTVTYTKQSESSYKFCVTYKANSSDFDPSSVGWSLASGGSVDTNSYYNSTDKTYLYLPSSHHKGQNCQTITPTLYGGGVSCGLLCEPKVQNNSNLYTDLGGSANSASDSKRQADINALQTHIEAYYATNGYYPTLAELNSSTWRTTNMQGLDAAALCDPSAKTTANCQLTATPQKGSYSYAPTTDTTSPCTTSGDCQNYTLTATLSTGKTYVQSYP